MSNWFYVYPLILDVVALNEVFFEQTSADNNKCWNKMLLKFLLEWILIKFLESNRIVIVFFRIAYNTLPPKVKTKPRDKTRWSISN